MNEYRMAIATIGRNNRRTAAVNVSADGNTVAINESNTGYNPTKSTTLINNTIKPTILA